MGERGLPARLLAPKYGAYLTFGALRAGKESAPGAASRSFVHFIPLVSDYF